MWEWAVSSKVPEEREVRERAVRALLLDGTNEKEHERVAALIEAAKFPKKDEAPVEPPEKKPKKARSLLYSPERRGFMRATVEDGIRRELDEMKAEATGTPFFNSAPAAPPSSRLAREKLLESLKTIADKPAK